MDSAYKGKHLFFDLDDTILFRGVFLPENTEAMHLARAAGAKLILNTGRARGNYESEIGEKCPIEWDAKIYGMSDVVAGGKILVRHKMTFRQLYPWYQYAMRHRQTFILEGYRRDLPIRFEKFGERLSVWKKLTCFLRLLFGMWISHTTKLTLLGEVDRSDLPKGDLEIVQQKRYFEVLPKGRDKGTAILEYCKLTGTDPKDCVCFGDSGNDVGMFRVCGKGICMVTSPRELIELASYQAKNQCGVAEGIDWLAQKGD